MNSERRPFFAVTSRGLWNQRADLATMLEGEIGFWPYCRARPIDGFVGWGRRPSGIKALRLGLARGKPVVTLEDGFLKSYAPGNADPAHSFVIDRRGIYFNAVDDNDLRHLIDDGIPDAAAIERARRAIQFIRENRLSKYNSAPERSLSDSGLPVGKPFVLLVDQVAGDASIIGARASAKSFSDMLEHARAQYPHATIAVRTHPAAGARSLLVTEAARLKIDIVTPARMNPWPLLEAADAVYTVSSQLGFEALMADTVVHAFGATYYSQRGLTEDHAAAVPSAKPVSLEQVFHATYIDYSHYLDLHDRRPVPIETTLDQILTVRDQRNQIARRVYTGGLSPWKRRALDPFVRSATGGAIHVVSFDKAVRMARENDGQMAIWGSGRALPTAVPAIRFEDGFIRSRGLGAHLALPCSLAMDGDFVYYDARGESRLEQIIASHSFPDTLTARARKLVDAVVARGVTKYNVGSDPALPEPESGRLRILIPGQVEKDASIRFGSPEVRTNRDLVSAVRSLYPDAFLVYKEHPDVASGLRSGGSAPSDADLTVRDGDIKNWLDWCDRVETMTSLTGFEALIRGKPVGVHGIPFYAGWGLTDDRMVVPRRTRRITVDMLAAATLILYPFYIHPLSAMPCTPEELVEEIALKRLVKISLANRLRQAVAQSINRSAVKIRDARN